MDVVEGLSAATSKARAARAYQAQGMTEDARRCTDEALRIVAEVLGIWAQEELERQGTTWPQLADLMDAERPSSNPSKDPLS